MRKNRLAVAILGFLVVLSVGYLSAQAYSSHVFEREFARTLSALQAEGSWQASREAVERGWFQSHGRVQLSHGGDEKWRASLPYTARHGLLTTRLSGALQIHVQPDGSVAEQTLFGDLLPSAQPRWTALFHSLERRTEGRLDVAAFELERDGARLTFTGAELDLEGTAEAIDVSGQVAPLQWQKDGEEVHTGALHLRGHYLLGDAGHVLQQRNELILERLDYRSRQRPTMTLSGVRYSDEAQLDEQLRLAVSVSLEQASVAGEALLAGHLNARIGRINGDAVRRLWGEVRALAETGSGLAGLNGAQRRVLVERLEPMLLATLTDSPQLTVETVTLASPAFGIDARGSGELTFDGRDIDALSVTRLYRTGEFRAWRERLNGRFIWQGVPPLVNLQLGLPLHTRKYEIRIDRGDIRINGQSLPALF